MLGGYVALQSKGNEVLLDAESLRGGAPTLPITWITNGPASRRSIENELFDSFISQSMETGEGK